MKSRLDPRHRQRIIKFRHLFAYSFQSFNQFFLESVKSIIDNITEIDQYISEAAPEWPVERLNRVDLAILRLAIYELLIEKNTPPKVVIDEAVELGKEYGSETTAKFVNGVLGTLLKTKYQA